MTSDMYARPLIRDKRPAPYYPRHQTAPFIRANHIIRHYRTLDCEDTYDAEDFFKISVQAGPMYAEFIRPDEKIKLRARQRARARALAIIAEVDAMRRNREWRKRLRWAVHEFEFVFEPYRVQLAKKYGRSWQFTFEMQRQKELWREEYEKREAKREATEALRKRSRHIRAGWRTREATHLEEELHRSYVQRPARGVFYYGYEQRLRDEALIRDTIGWVKAFNSPLLLKIVCKLIDEQPIIHDQVTLCTRLNRAAERGELQGVLEQIILVEREAAGPGEQSKADG